MAILIFVLVQPSLAERAVPEVEGVLKLGGIVLAVLGSFLVSCGYIMYQPFFKRYPGQRLTVVKFGYALTVLMLSAPVSLLYISGQINTPLVFHPLLIFAAAIAFPLSFSWYVSENKFNNIIRRKTFTAPKLLVITVSGVFSPHSKVNGM